MSAGTAGQVTTIVGVLLGIAYVLGFGRVLRAIGRLDVTSPDQLALARAADRGRQVVPWNEKDHASDAPEQDEAESEMHAAVAATAAATLVEALWAVDSTCAICTQAIAQPTDAHAMQPGRRKAVTILVHQGDCLQEALRHEVNLIKRLGRRW